MPGKTGEHFKPGDLVFAKMKGFPPWPARVCKSESDYKKRVPVFFFGTHQIGHLPPKNIVPFVGNKVKYGNSGVRIKGFTEGMWEIQNTPGVGSKPRNAQTTPPKPVSSPSTSAAKPTSLPKTAPAKLTVSPQTEPSKQVTDEGVKTTFSTPSAEKGNSTVVRRRRSNAKGSVSVVALAARRATLRSSPGETTPDSTQTSVVVTSTEVPAVVMKRRGRKPRSVPTENTTGITTTDSSTVSETASHKPGRGPNDGESTAETNAMSTEKKKAPDILSEAEDFSAVSQETGSSSCGDIEEATQSVATRKKACKVVAEQQMKPVADANTPEQSSKSLEKEEKKLEENEQSSGSQGLKKKKEGKEILREMCQETQEDGKKAFMMEKPEAKRGGRKRKDNETDKLERYKKTKQDEDAESKKEVVAKRRRMEETKQRQGMRGMRGRRGRRPGTGTREWIASGSTEKQQVTEVMVRTVGKKRGWKRKAKGATEEEVETKVREENEEEDGEKAGKADDKGIKKIKVASDEKNKETQIDEDRLETEMSKKKESPLVKNERQHHLAANRDSVLKSLRGLLKAGRGGRRRREASRSYLKPLDRVQKKSGPKASDRKRVKQSKATTKVTEKITEEKRVPKRVENIKEDKQKDDKKTKRGETIEVKRDEQKVEPQKAKMPNEVKEKGPFLSLGVKDDDRMKPEEKKDKKTKEKQEEERSTDDTKKHKQEEKNERKIIGKIVKASAGQKAKVQMKTVIGGAIKAAEMEEEKDSKEKLESNREKPNEPETKGRGSVEVKNAEKSGEVEGKSDKEKTSNVAKKEKLTIVEKDKRMRRSYEGEQKRLEKDSATSSGKKNESKAGNGALAVKKVREDEKKGKPERESQQKEEPKAESKVQTESEGTATAKPQRGMLESKSDKTSAASSETEQEQPDICEKEEEEADEKKSDSSDGEKVRRQRKSSTMTLTDSTLHRIHGDIRISLKTDNPDINKCLMALDQLSMVYVTSKHIQRHTELVVTLRKLRCYRASQTIMDKASMLYNRFKNAYLLGEGEEVVSAGFLHTLLEEKEREEAQRAERYRKRTTDADLAQEVKLHMDQEQGRKRAGGGVEEAEGGVEGNVQRDVR